MLSGLRIDWYAIGCFCLGLSARIAGIPFVSVDATKFLIPWYTTLCQGGFATFATNFSNYSPPYLYLLWLASHVFGPSHPLLAIKYVGITCDVGLCACVGLLVERCSSPVVPWERTFAITWCIPTVVANSSIWGQCDALYAAFVVGALVAAYSRPILALSLFGVAVSIKLQAMFAAPALGLLLITGRLPWHSVLAAALSWLGLLVPAALAGRSWRDLLTIYAVQADSYHRVSMSAPNPWELIVRIYHRLSWNLDHYYPILSTIALLATILGAILYLILGRRRLTPNKSSMPELAFVAAFLFPFLLPEMHDRYFYLADVLSVALAIADRRWLPIAVLVQIGSLSAYAPFLLGITGPLILGVAANTLVFAILLLRWYPRAEKLLPAWLRGAVPSIARP